MSHIYKRGVFILNAFLIIGLVVHSVILFIINGKINCINISNIDQIFLWRWLAEKINSICNLIYIIGHILLMYVSIKRKNYFSLKSLLLYIGIQTVLMFVCTVPFGVLDLEFLGDYLFPIWSMIIDVVVIFLIYIVICYKNKKVG